MIAAEKVLLMELYEEYKDISMKKDKTAAINTVR